MNHKFSIGNTNPFYSIPVEIIIPFDGNHSKVINLFESIYRTVHSNKYMITLVDDCSLNEYFKTYIEKSNLPNIRYLKTSKKGGFSSCVNLALLNPYSESIKYVLIMNYKIKLEENYWLQNLGEFLIKMKSNSVKMVSPLIDNPFLEEKLVYGKKGEKRDGIIIENGFLPIDCVLCHRDLFKNVGLLSEDRTVGDESEDFAVRMKIKGYKQAVCGNSWVSCS